MRAERTGHLSRCLFLDDQALKRLCDLLADHFQTVEVTTEHKSHMEYTYADSRIHTITNPRRDAIRAIRVRATTNDRSSSATLCVDNHWSRSVYVDFSGPKASIDALNRKLEDWFDSARPAYAVLATLNPLTFALVIGAFMGGLVVPLSLFSPRLSLLAVVLGGLAPSLSYLVLRTLFPATAFALGDAARYYDVLEKARWGVVVALAVGVIGSIIATWLW